MNEEPQYTRYLTRNVAERIAAENALWEGKAETSWAGQWDFRREVVTSARLLFRGNGVEVAHLSRDVNWGEVDIHCHTITAYLSGSGITQCFPSEADTGVAAQLAGKGAGMLILSHDCRYGYLVRGPLPPWAWKWSKSFRLGHWEWLVGYRHREGAQE